MPTHHYSSGQRSVIFKRARALGPALAVLIGLVVSGCATTHSVQTPAATPATVQGRLELIARQALGDAAHDLAATYDTQGEALELAATLAGGVPRTEAEISAAQEHVKLLCFRAQRAEWTSGNPLRSVTVTILGPTLDDYADITTGPYGAAVLTSATAATLAWGSLSADSAWQHYDRVWLAPTYAPNQHFGAPPAATATPTR
jgi:hypothetical protein